MNKFIRFYNQNRYTVWNAIIITIGIITMIQVLDKLAYKQLETENITSTSNIKNTSTSNINTNYSVVTGQENKDDNIEIIDEFINFCNNNQTELAYKMISDECKDELYPTLNDFIENYHKRIFDSKKVYSCQAWITTDDFSTYRIDFVKDMLATGETSKSSILDYYTFVKNDNNGNKININKFVGIKEINKTQKSNDLTVNILRKKVYMDYEIYDFEVLNQTKNAIMLDDMQKTKNVYIEDGNNQKYYWYSHEILENDITVRRGVRKNISIKFNKLYNPNNDAIKIVFSNIILNNKKTINLGVDI